MAERKTISINKLDKIIAHKKPKENKSILLFDIGDHKTVEIVVSPLISYDDMDSFVRSVVDAVCQDGVYHYEDYDLTIDKALLAYYTNINYRMQNSKLIELVFCTSLIEEIKNVINQNQLQYIMGAISDGVKFKKEEMLSAQKIAVDAMIQNVHTEQDKILKSIQELVKPLQELANNFKDYDVSKLEADIRKIVNTPESEMVDRILSFQKRQE